MTPVTLVSTRTSDGALLDGAVAGPDGARAGLLLVHGAWGNFYSSPTAELLTAAPPRGLRVLALNQRAHDLGSLSNGQPRVGFVHHRVADSALDFDAALALLLADGVEDVVVVAHSYGSGLALRWLVERRPAEVTGLVLLAPAPPIQIAQRWFVEGALEHHLALAARAVAAGEPHRLLTLSSTAPIAMVAEAATILDAWGSDCKAMSHNHVGAVDLPMLVTSGAREPAAYRDYAEEIARLAGSAEFIRLDDDHYYSVDRAELGRVVGDWCERHFARPG